MPFLCYLHLTELFPNAAENYENSWLFPVTDRMAARFGSAVNASGRCGERRIRARRNRGGDDRFGDRGKHPHGARRSEISD